MMLLDDFYRFSERGDLCAALKATRQKVPGTTISVPNFLGDSPQLGI
jgi:hypothetical protein